MRWIAIHCQRVVVADVAIIGGVITNVAATITTIVATVDGGCGWPGTGVVAVETDCCRCLRQQQHAGALRLRL